MRVKRPGRLSIVGACIALCAVAGSAAATTIVRPTDFGGPYCLSPSFGPATCALSGEYRTGGLEFSGMGVSTATFIDPPPAWGGINGAGVVDLIAPVNAMIVIPGTATPGITNFISVEAGFAGLNTLQLGVFNSKGVLITSVLNDGSFGTGPDGTDLMTISAPGIAKFSVSTPGNDTFGVDQIELGPITPLGATAPVVSFPSLLFLVLTMLAFGGWSVTNRR